jgi:hypothetical protein
MSPPILPDVSALGVEALLARQAVTALVADRIYVRMPEYQQWPLLLVTTVVDDEQDAEGSVGLARLQIGCWGQGILPRHEDEANLIARTVRSAARDLRGVYTAGTIEGASPVAPGVVPAPDPQTGRARCLVDLLLIVTPV